MAGGTSFGKTICSICYEDLKPLVEDLQAISLCGHVFHELWLLFSLSLYEYVYICMNWKLKSQNMWNWFCFCFWLCVFETLVYNSGSSTVRTRRNAVALCASRNVREAMPIASTFSRSGTPTIRSSLRFRTSKIPRNCVVKFRDWRTRSRGLTRS